MPDQNQPDPNQNSQQPVTTPPVIFPQSDLPPLPPAFQNLSKPEKSSVAGPINEPAPSMATPPIPAATEPPVDTGSGSAAPPDISSVVSKPKKKFGGGKIIATILGLIILVGGVGAGIVVTQQQQIFKPKASNIVCPCGATAYAGETCADVCPKPSTNPDCGGYGKFNCSCADGTTGYVCANGSKTCTDFCQGHNNTGGGGGSSCGSGSVSGCQGKSIGTIIITCQANEDVVCQSNGTKDGNGLSNCNANYSTDSNCSNTATNSNSQCSGCSKDECHCTSTDCSTAKCDNGAKNSCIASSGAWCANYTQNGMTCCNAGTQCAPGGGCTGGASPPPSAPPSKPPASPSAPSCTNIKVFKADDLSTALTSDQLKSLQSGNKIYMCAYPSLAKVIFTINGVAQPAIAPTGACMTQAGSCLCMNYTIPSSVNTFNISAQISN